MCSSDLVVLLALPDGAGTRGWVDARRARCCKVVGGGDGMCARRLSGCQLAVLWTSCPWWPSFLDNLYRGLGGDIPNSEYFLRLGADWLCCAPVANCGCPA